MEKENRVTAFLIKKYGADTAKKAMEAFKKKQSEYIQKDKA
jgi:hypothetical protein